jgi:hypothetical protein
MDGRYTGIAGADSGVRDGPNENAGTLSRNVQTLPLACVASIFQYSPDRLDPIASDVFLASSGGAIFSAPGTAVAGEFLSGTLE